MTSFRYEIQSKNGARSIAKRTPLSFQAEDSGFRLPLHLPIALAFRAAAAATLTLSNPYVRAQLYDGSPVEAGADPWS